MSTQAYVSDELTHFIGQAKPNNAERYALFLKILGDRVVDPRSSPVAPIVVAPRQGWLKASYHEEFGSGFTMRSDGHKQLSTNEAVRCTMLCFCDIPPGQLQIHMRKYGSFGIAFSKHFLLRRGATPVYYVPRNSTVQSEEAHAPSRSNSTFCGRIFSALASISKSTSRALMGRPLF